MRKEFSLRSDELYHNLDDDLHQVRRVASLGLSPGEWAQKRGMPLEYARALRRFLEQD
jgi:hypothetical protein